MAVQINIPKLGMTMSEATLVEWKAKEGDWIEKGSVVLEIETEKISWEVEAIASGFLHIVVEKGNIAKVGAIVGLIAETKEELEKLQKASPKDIYITEAKEPPTEETRAGVGQAPIVGKKEEERIQISPVARKLAEENLIDIASIAGTGPGGRIILTDVEKAIEAKKATPKAAAKITAKTPTETYEGKRVARSVPLEGMRKAIADLMYYSLTNSAQVTVAADIDMTEVVRVRNALVGQAEHIGTKVSYTDLFVLVLARVLKDNPIFNASLIDGEIKFWEDINIGIAVSLGEQGLLVPVVKNADQKSIAQIALLSKELVEKARENNLRPDDIIGGTFTFSNIGTLSISRHQTPIIVPPQSAILAASAIKDTPVVKEGQIVIRPMATFSLTYDHRIIDGEAGERFLLRFNELLQSSYLLSL